MIEYRLNAELPVPFVVELYEAAGLSRARPRDEVVRLQTMLTCSNLTVSAWLDERLIGLARSISDYSYATYVSDLAVHPKHQRQGIGRELLRCSQAAAPQATLVLIAAAGCDEFYRRLGLRPHAACYILHPQDALR